MDSRLHGNDKKRHDNRKIVFEVASAHFSESKEEGWVAGKLHDDTLRKDTNADKRPLSI